MRLIDELSEKEKQMFILLGWEYLFLANLEVSALYNLAVQKCFLQKDCGPAEESLRRCVIALSNAGKSHPYRCTKEFDDLIILY
jgi:hypothetical protein